jgi:hypothetical protein
MKILLAAANKISPTSLKSYRGGSTKWFSLKTLGQVIVLDKITSISASKATAENFVENQLLIINAKSARDISPYSVTNEQELLLLPGIKLRVDNISYVSMDLSYENTENIKQVRLVELTEI